MRFAWQCNVVQYFFSIENIFLNTLRFFSIKKSHLIIVLIALIEQFTTIWCIISLQYLTMRSIFASKKSKNSNFKSKNSNITPVIFRSEFLIVGPLDFFGVAPPPPPPTHHNKNSKKNLQGPRTTILNVLCTYMVFF